MAKLAGRKRHHWYPALKAMFGHDELDIVCEGARLLLREYAANEVKAPHIHTGLTFFVPLRGGMYEACGRKNHEVSAFRLVMQSKEVEHRSTVFPIGMRALFVDVPDAWLQDRQIEPLSCGRYDLVNDTRVLAAIRIALELASGVAEAANVEESLLSLCAPEYLQNDLYARGEPKWLKTAEEFIDAEHGQQISLRKISAEIGVHPVHLARIFRKKHGRSIGGYITGVRVASALRKSADMPFGQAAVASGFADQSHFGRGVRKELNRAPQDVAEVLWKRKTFQPL